MATITQAAIGLILALHGLVHGWSVALSRDWVDYEEATGWNGRSWLLSDVLREGLILDVASVGYVLVAAGYVCGGLGYAIGQGWAVPVLVGSAVLSTIVLLVTWDGQLSEFGEKGGVGVIVNAVVVVWLLVLS